MKLHTAWVRFLVEGEEVQGYFARSARAEGPLPGVVLLQEAFGVDAFVRDVAERFATNGYATLAPDLFSYRGKPEALAADRIEQAKRFRDGLPPDSDPSQRAAALAKLPAETARQVEETLALLFPDQRPWADHVAVGIAARQWLAAGPAKGRKVGAVGFCLGGALAMRLACADPELSAAVSFYGFAPPLEQIPRAQAAVLALYAENDPKLNATLAPLAEAMKAHGKAFDHHTYPGTGHAFFNDTRPRFHADASRDAWARTLAFLASYLG